jgi:hypothetical protein
VVSGRASRFPVRSLCGQTCRDGRPVIEIPDRPVPVGQARRCRTSRFSLPATANSRQYRPTGAARSSSPRSARTSAHSAVIVLVTDQTFVIVSRCHGIVRSASANPPQTSTTGSPSTKTATEAPASPSSSSPASTLGTAVNSSSYEPRMSAMRSIQCALPPRSNRIPRPSTPGRCSCRPPQPAEGSE